MDTKHLIVVVVHCVFLCSAWNGFIIDSTSTYGSTQLLLPNPAAPTQAGVNFGLSNFVGGKAVVLPDGNAYFIGGSNSAIVKRFDPVTNATSTMSPMLTARYAFGATVVGNTIIVCGGMS
jgi:hypothetical protein